LQVAAHHPFDSEVPFVSNLVRCLAVGAIAAGLVLGTAGAATAQQRGGGGGGRGGPPMTPLVYRQNIMEQLAQSTSALTAIRNGTAGSPTHLLARATIIQQLASMLPEAFAANVGGEGSRSLPAIWESPAEFASRIQALRTAADQLLEAARGGDAEAVGTAQTAVQQTCAGCHMQFRGPAPDA
jgi:cytochrome c556